MKHLGNLLLVLFSLLLTFLAFTAFDVYKGWQKIAKVSGEQQLRGLHQPDPLLGWRLVPNTTARHSKEESFDVVYRIDGRGFKTVDNRGEATARIFFFGDSFTFGHGVTNGEDFVGVLARVHLAPGVHAFNAGVMAYGLPQMVGRFQELLPDLRAGDRVVFTPLSTDLRRNMKDFTFPAQFIFQDALVRVEHMPDWNTQRGALEPVPLRSAFNTVQALLVNAKNLGRAFTKLRRLGQPDTTIEARAMLAWVGQEVEKRGGRFAVLFPPTPREVEAGAYEEGIAPLPVIPVWEPFVQAGMGKRVELERDVHWNGEGHRITAGILARTLRAAGVLEAGMVKGPLD